MRIWCADLQNNSRTFPEPPVNRFSGHYPDKAVFTMQKYLLTI